MYVLHLQCGSGSKYYSYAVTVNYFRAYYNTELDLLQVCTAQDGKFHRIIVAATSIVERENKSFKSNFYYAVVFFGPITLFEIKLIFFH